MNKKIGAIDPKIKAEIDMIHDLLSKTENRGTLSWHFAWYNRINDLAKRI